MTILEKIIKARQSRGLKQSDMANILKIEQSKYSRIENGVSKLTLEQLEQIAAAFEMSITELFNLGESNSVELLDGTELEAENQRLKKELNTYKEMVEILKENLYVNNQSFSRHSNFFQKIYKLLTTLNTIIKPEKSTKELIENINSILPEIKFEITVLEERKEKLKSLYSNKTTK